MGFVRKLNLQRKQLANLKGYNEARYQEQKEVFYALLKNPKYLFTMKRVDKNECRYAKYLNTLTYLAKEKQLYKSALEQAS